MHRQSTVGIGKEADDEKKEDERHVIATNKNNWQEMADRSAG